MAKAQNNEVMQVEKKDIATISPGVPDFMKDSIKGYEAAGVSSKASDNLIPMLRILQDLSGEVKTRDPRYIEGAVVGDVYMSAVRKLWKGDEGFLFQPCAFDMGWVERQPRDAGGNFVAQYREPPDGMTQVDKFKWMLGDNDIIETRYHFGYVVGESEEDFTMPAVITLSGTGHTVSKAWTTLMNTHRIGGIIAPSFSYLYRVKTRLTKRNNNEWYLYDIMNSDWVRDRNQVELGKALYDSVTAGDKIVDTSDMNNDVEGADKEVPF